MNFKDYFELRANSIFEIPCSIFKKQGAHVPRLATLLCKQSVLGSIPIASTKANIVKTMLENI